MNLLLLSLTVPFASAAVGGGSHSTVQVCNRGFCYTKKEDWTLSPTRLGKRKGGGLEFCGHNDCEVLSILGSDIVEEEEAIECVNCAPSPAVEEQPNDTKPELKWSFEILDDMDLDKRRSWKEEPKKGNCYDNELGYMFDCNLVQILE